MCVKFSSIARTNYKQEKNFYTVTQHIKVDLLVKITEKVDSKDMGLVQPVTITSFDGISSLLWLGKFHEKIPE